jgi:CARDB
MALEQLNTWTRKRFGLFRQRRLKMNSLRIVVALILTMSFAGCASLDLVVTDWQLTGAPTINSENKVEVPVRAVVRNQGSAAAGIFKVAAEYLDSQGRIFVATFTVPGQSDIWYPHTTMALAAGSDATFDGKLTFHPAVHGETVSLTATADSCSGDELMPEYCRVNESNESNNKSTAISVPLP